MVWMVVQNGNGTVKLFRQQYAHHAVRQRQIGKTQQQACLSLQAVGQPVGTADNHANMPPVLLPFFQVACQILRCRSLAMLTN